NTGKNAFWSPFNAIRRPNPLDPTSPITTNLTQMVAVTDPLTGHARLIFGDAQGIYTGVDNGQGTLTTGIGTATTATGSRNGNLQMAQFFQGAAQPSVLAAQVANALLYGTSQDNGAHDQSGPNVLDTGFLQWTAPWPSAGDPYGDATGVGTDQTGSGAA